MDLKPAPVLGRRSSSKLKSLPIDARILLQLPRLGLATEEQLEHLDKLYPEGGQKAIQALLNLMQSGVVDGVIWNRESWVGDSVSTVTGIDGDKLDLLSPVAMPPTGGCNLMYTEGVVENMLNQLAESVEKAMNDNASSTAALEVMAVDVPRQVVMLVQRIRFTAEVQRCIRESRQISTIFRSNNEIKKRLGEKLLDKELPEGEISTLMAIQMILHEQNDMLKVLMECKTSEELEPAWKESMRFYHDDKELATELKLGDKVFGIGHEYYPPRMLITTPFTNMLRWAFLNTMGEGGSRLLVLIGPPGCGKTGMLGNVGHVLGTLPTIIRCSEQVPATGDWWKRRLTSAQITGGGSMAPIILTQAHRCREEVLTTALGVAGALGVDGVALCVTMAPGPEAQKLLSGVLAGAYVINVPNAELEVIAAGQLAAEGLAQSVELAVPLANILNAMRNECAPQAHYDFGPRTLMQLCTQIGSDRRKAIPEATTVVSVLERCLAPKLVKDDCKILMRLLKEQFNVEKRLVSPSEAEEGRWYRVGENIRTITKIEPDCCVLPVPPADTDAFYEEFCKMLNRLGSAMVRFDYRLCDLTPDQLLGTMPKRGPDGQFEATKDGLLVAALRQAMNDHVDVNQQVWITMETGDIQPEKWECLHELLDDSGSINLATGEQLRLNPNLRFLFVMPGPGNTSQDTFSRTAVVYTDPPPM